VGKGPVQLTDRARAGLGQVGQQMALSLGQAQGRSGRFQEKSDPVGGAMDGRHQEQASGFHAVYG
jgi:hypothetical protein